MVTGYVIGAIRLATTAMLQLRALSTDLNWKVAVVAKRMAPMAKPARV